MRERLGVVAVSLAFAALVLLVAGWCDLVVLAG